MATDLLNAGMGDIGRLQFIIQCIQNKKPLYNTDKKYLARKYQELETKLEILSGGKKKKPTKTILSESKLDEIVDKALSREKQTESISVPQNQEKSFLSRLFGKKV